MTTGTVKWFNDDVGFGLVTSDNSDEDLFAHYSEINMSGFKSIKKGQKVSFEETRVQGSGEATNILVLR